jgi:dihydroorotate dehydrogenase electron transfer subunit
MVQLMSAETQTQEESLPTFDAAVPTLNSDGTITATIARPIQQDGAAARLALALPSTVSQGTAGGCFFLARCGAQSEWDRANQWSFALRRPLFVATVYPLATDVGSTAADPAGAIGELLLLSAAADCIPWLATLRVGGALNLLGPFGLGFTLQPLARNLLLLADLARLPLLSGLMDQMLDRNGRVTLVLKNNAAPPDEVRSRLPIPVELRVATDDEQWRQQLDETIRWADQVAAALPPTDYPFLAHHIRTTRMRLESNFAHCLVETDLPCGVGACLACTVPLPDGSLTRACIHGPVFDLATLYGK